MKFDTNTLWGAILQKAYNTWYKLWETVDKIKESKPPKWLVKAVNTITSPIDTVVNAVESVQPLSTTSQNFIKEVKWEPYVTAGWLRTQNAPKQAPPTVSTPPATVNTPPQTVNTPKPTVTAWGLRTQNVPKQTQPIVTETKPTEWNTIPSKMTQEEVKARNAFLKERNTKGTEAFLAKQNKPKTDKTKPNTDLLTMNDDETARAKLKEVEGLKQSDVASNQSDRDRTLATGELALENFRNAVGIDKDGNVDMNRKGSIGASLQWDFNKYEAEQKELSSQYESSRKGRVAAEMRAKLLARGVDISKIPQEQLIALSDDVWAKAFEDIYSNKQNTLTALSSKQENLTSKLNDLRSQWLLAEDKYNTLKATVESQFEKTKNDIQRAYVNDIFQITDTAKAKKEATKTSAANSLENMLKAVSASEAPALRARFTALIDKGLSATDILKTVANDTQFKDLAKKLADQNTEASKAELALKNKKTESEITENEASAAAKTKTAEAAVIRANKAGSGSKDKIAAQYNTPVSASDFATMKSYWVTQSEAGKVTNKGQAMDLIRKYSSNMN